MLSGDSTIRWPTWPPLIRYVAHPTDASEVSRVESPLTPAQMRRIAERHFSESPISDEIKSIAGNPLKNRILRSLPGHELQEISSLLELVQFKQHAILHEPAQKLRFAYFPNSGLISLIVATEDGRTVEAGMVGSEGGAGLQAAFGLSKSVLRQVVQISGDGFRIRSVALQNAVSSAPQFQLAISRSAILQGMQIAQTAACNRLHDGRQRLARWLLLAHDRIDSNILPLTHDFLATMLGTDRPSVSVAARILQTEGIIRYTRGVITILHRRKLEDSACECYRVIRNLFRTLAPLNSGKPRSR
jgi:CRP-like cAMP-binding protein